MRVLLFNDNPVVTKLVTLSTQKTGDELEVCSNVEEINFNECDLLIIDDELYNDESLLALEASVNAKKYLFMSKRGVEKPANFDYSINKPFLPTDLVELFSAISSSLSNTNSEDETFELDDFDDELILEDNNEILELDTDDVKIDEDVLLDLDDIEEIDEDTLDITDSVLDKDDLAEVQSLLDDTEEDPNNDNISDLDDIDGLEIDDSLFDKESISKDINEELILDDELDIEEESEELILDDELDTEEESEELTLDNELDIKEESEELTLDDELDIKEESEELTLDDELDTEEESEELTLDDELDIEEESLSTLEDEIKNAVSELSDEELQESIDEDTLLDIVSNDELDDFSSLDDLDEHSLKVAVGEADEIIENKKDNSPSDAIDALKTLLKALESDDIAQSLKGMNININISFGDKN